MKKVFVLIPASLLIFHCCLAGAYKKIHLPSVTKHIGKANSFLSTPSDYFRSVQSGDWGSTATWESSADNSTWMPATLTPANSAQTISIRNTHTVTVSTNQDMDEVVIENGGHLYHSGGTLSVFNGTGDDINVQSGGVFTLANSTGPAFASGATAFISPNAILRVSASGLTFAGSGVNASNFVYSNASVLEYTLTFTAFASSGVTYFPNVNASTIPVFRITGNVGGVGGAGNTVINGLFEVNGAVTFQNSGTKTFRNGIIGSGTISSDAASGKFIINGANASLGGTGSLTLPAAGMDIGPGTTVDMVSDKSITGNISLLSNALVNLNTYNLTMTGSIGGGSVTSHIVTNSTGKLVMNNIGASFVLFPIGANASTINPLIIYNGNNLNYGARVETGINPSIAIPLSAVNRTWVVRASAIPAGPVNVNFFYSAGDGNGSFNYTTTVEQGFYTNVWNVINTGLVQAGSYQVATTVSSFAANTDAPMVIANIGAILAVHEHISLHALKQHGKVLLNWDVSGNAPIEQFYTERSGDGRNYSVIAQSSPGMFNFTDMQPMPGLNYYRIKAVGRDGKFIYSNIAAVLNAATGFSLLSIAPNPVVGGNFMLNMTAAQRTHMEIMITDMQGRLVQKQVVDLVAGFNSVPVNVFSLAKGTYRISGNTAEGRSRELRFVVQ